jgi:hypothetical protein
MKKNLKTFVLILFIAFILIQFFRPTKNMNTGQFSNAITTQFAVPADVQTILEKACNDCHSNNTKYPWYSNIQPVAWWLDKHVVEGKNHLNFDDFTSYRIAKQYKRMDDCIEEIKEGGMPLSSYTWIHKDAILTDAEKQIIYDWCNTIRDSIKAKYPADSLIMPKRKS